LDAGKFADFRTTFSSLESSALSDLKALVSSPATITKLRQAITNCLALTYRKAPLKVVMAALNVSKTKDIAGMSAVVEYVDTDSVTFLATADNTKRNRVFQEGVQFTDISDMLSKRTVPSQYRMNVMKHNLYSLLAHYHSVSTRQLLCSW
jgi:hypothetical protein